MSVKHTVKTYIKEGNMQQHTVNKMQRSKLPEFISVISANSCARIRIDDIEVIEQDGRKIHVITADRDYTFYGAMNTLAESLNERAFFRPIRRMIINLDHIRDISGFYINFNSGQSVAMGRNAMADTKKAYKRYLLRYPPYTLWEPAGLMHDAVAESIVHHEPLHEDEMTDNQDALEA